ncbi:biotin--[acetyl-CoA-carboxylase] ligase [Solicola sp. PLA-1-18]|uniref:biotin--[acetyl-CoA-carboxylase] ligase n=1 Tax=Solicola sp. PLA-1-18 TaxID=3380532 RepID=UPI003B7CADAC
MTFSDLDRPPLDAAALTHALVGPGTWWRDVQVSASTASTNADLAALAADGAPEGTLVTTDHQQAGRGRMGRPWTVPAQAAISVSVLLRPDPVPADRWSWLPLLVGIAVAETVQAAGVDAVLKWPNDVLVGDLKLSGILVERVSTDVGPAAVVGVGLNVHQRQDELPVPTATSLALAGAVTTDRTVLLRSYARTLEALYRAWAAAEGDPQVGLLDSYVRRCSTLGQQVRVERTGEEPLLGEAEAVDAGGRLVVRSEGVRHALSAGDVVHVRRRA